MLDATPGQPPIPPMGDDDAGEDGPCQKCDGFGLVTWVRRGGFATEPCSCPAGDEHRSPE